MEYRLFLDGFVGLLVFFLLRVILDFGFEGFVDVKGLGFVRVLLVLLVEKG